MKQPSDSDVQEFIREIDEEAKQQELATGEAPNPFHVAMFKGFARAMASPSGRALMFLFSLENKPHVDQFRSAAVRNSYRERFAQTLEEGSVEQNRLLMAECPWFARLSPKRRGELLRLPSRRELAASIREEMERVEETVTPEGAQSRQLAAEERVRLARALKLAGIELDIERLREARRAEDWDTYFEIALRFQFAQALILVPPPPTESFGTRNRSPMWLASDRKACEWTGCRLPIRNAAHFCKEHSVAAERSKDAEKKSKAYVPRALVAAVALASRGTLGPAPDSNGLVSGEIEPGPDLRTLRRKLESR